MTGSAGLRGAIGGLVAFAAEEEAVLLAASAPGAVAADGPDHWAAPAAIAHNTEFKHQQVQRLQAVLSGTTPPAFGDIDHASAQVYQRYAGQPAGAVAAASRRVTDELIGALPAIPDEDLTDPRRNSWLGGRQLWLQIIVRGFWHPIGHIGEYHLAHGQPERGIALHARRRDRRPAGSARPRPAAWPATALAVPRPARAGRMTHSPRSGRPSA
jgi:hypothetical protein